MTTIVRNTSNCYKKKGLTMRIESARMATYIASLSLCVFVLGTESASAADAQASPEVLLRGPVDSVNAGTSQILVLGQWVSASGINAESMLGHVVAVNGTIDARGAYVVSTIQDLRSVEYVPGATAVHLTGTITSINKFSGVLALGGITVDYTGALHTLMADDLAVGKI